MKEFTDDKIKKYLGLDVGQLMNEVIEEMNKNNGSDNDDNNGKMICTIHETIITAKSVNYK